MNNTTPTCEPLKLHRVHKVDFYVSRPDGAFPLRIQRSEWLSAEDVRRELVSSGNWRVDIIVQKVGEL